MAAFTSHRINSIHEIIKSTEHQKTERWLQIWLCSSLAKKHFGILFFLKNMMCTVAFGYFQ